MKIHLLLSTSISCKNSSYDISELHAFSHHPSDSNCSLSSSGVDSNVLSRNHRGNGALSFMVPLSLSNSARI